MEQDTFSIPEHRFAVPDYHLLGPDPELLTDERLQRIVSRDRLTARVIAVQPRGPRSKRATLPDKAAA